MTAKKRAETDLDTNINANEELNNETENEEGDNEMSETTAIRPQTVITNGNGNGNHRLSDIRPMDISMAEYEAMTHEQLINLVIPRLSRIRTKAELVSKIRSGKIKLGQSGQSATTLMSWTFKNIRVSGVSINLRGVKEPKVTLTQEEFNALTNDQKADLIEKYTRERRVAEDIYPALLRLGMKLSAYDVVFLTNGRLSVEGIVIENRGHSGKQSTIVEGVSFE
jgi:hypothetical protein